MASKLIGGFPPGATVAVYSAADQLPSSSLSPPPPSGLLLEQETAGAGGVMFTGLAPSTQYVATDGQRSVFFRTDDDALPSVSAIDGIPDWAPNTPYAALTIVRDPNGVLQRSNAALTSRASFDATEQAAWTPLADAPGAAAPPAAHKATHASNGTDALSPADIGAATATDASNNAAAIASETNRALAAEAALSARIDALTP